MKRRHLTPQELKERLKHAAKQSRMATRTPWTAMGVLTGFALYKSEGFKGQRILKITDAVAEYERRWIDGEITIDDCNARLKEKTGWDVNVTPYTDEDLKSKKGSCRYLLEKTEMEAKNTINMQSARYMVWLFNALMDEYGYGKDRLTRVEEYMLKLIDDYTFSRTTVDAWRKVLRDDLGLVFEQPIDPITQNIEEF